MRRSPAGVVAKCESERLGVRVIPVQSHGDVFDRRRRDYRIDDAATPHVDRSMTGEPLDCSIVRVYGGPTTRMASIRPVLKVSRRRPAWSNVTRIHPFYENSTAGRMRIVRRLGPERLQPHVTLIVGRGRDSVSRYQRATRSRRERDLETSRGGAREGFASVVSPESLSAIQAARVHE